MDKRQKEPGKKLIESLKDGIKEDKYRKLSPASCRIAHLPAEDNSVIRKKDWDKSKKQMSPEDFDHFANLSHDYWKGRIQRHPDDEEDDETFGLLDRNETIK